MGGMMLMELLVISPAHLSKTRANACIRSQLTSSQVPTATVVDDQEEVDE